MSYNQKLKLANIYDPFCDLIKELYKREENKNILKFKSIFDYYDKVEKMENLNLSDYIQIQCEIIKSLSNLIREFFYQSDVFWRLSHIASNGVVGIIILYIENYDYKLIVSNLEMFKSHIKFVSEIYKIIFDIIEMQNGKIIYNECDEIKFSEIYEKDIENLHNYESFANKFMKSVLSTIEPEIDSGIIKLQTEEKTISEIIEFKYKIYDMDYKNPNELLSCYQKELPEIFTMLNNICSDISEQKRIEYSSLYNMFYSINLATNCYEIDNEKKKNNIDSSYENIMNKYNNAPEKKKWSGLIDRIMKLEHAKFCDSLLDNFPKIIENSEDKGSTILRFASVYNKISFESTIKWVLIEQLVNLANGESMCVDKIFGSKMRRY